MFLGEGVVEIDPGNRGLGGQRQLSRGEIGFAGGIVRLRGVYGRTDPAPEVQLPAGIETNAIDFTVGAITTGVVANPVDVSPAETDASSVGRPDDGPSAFALRRREQLQRATSGSGYGQGSLNKDTLPDH